MTVKIAALILYKLQTSKIFLNLLLQLQAPYQWDWTPGSVPKGSANRSDLTELFSPSQCYSQFL